MSLIMWRKLEPEEKIQCGDVWWDGPVDPNAAQHSTYTPTYTVVFAPVKEYGLTVQRVQSQGVEQTWHCWRPFGVTLEAPAPPEPVNQDRKIEMEL